MKKKTNRDFGIVFLISAIVVLGINCGSGDSSTTPTIDVSDNIARGWSLYEQFPPDYNGAVTEFSQAIFQDSENVEAYTGRGWAYSGLAFGQGDQNYSLARDNFNEAIERDNSAYDAYAGLAFVELVLNDYSSAIDNAKVVIQGDPTYIFSHDPGISIPVLKLILGQAYFFLGDYSEVVLILIELQPGEFHPIDNPEILLAQLQELLSNSLF